MTYLTLNRATCFLIAVLLCGVMTLGQQTDAAQLQTVQSGETTLGTSDTFVEVPITAVDTSKTFLVFGARLDDNMPDYTQISGQFINSTTLRFERAMSGATNEVTIRWYAAEFVSGVTVYHGSTTIDQTTKDISLPGSIDTDKSLPIISFRKAGAGYDGDDFVRAEMMDSDTLRLEVNRIPLVTGFGVVEWQVVEYIDSAVQTGNVQFGTGDSSMTDSITSIDTGKSWLLYTYESEDGINTNIGQKLVRGVITDATTLTFDRDSNGQALDLTWYLVEFTDGTTVQNGSQHFNASHTKHNIMITSDEADWSIAVGGYFMRGGKSPYTADDNPGAGWFTFELQNPTKMVIERDVKQAAEADVGWFVIQFIGNATAVGLVSFTATRAEPGVLLLWQTGNEMDSLGFHLYRGKGRTRHRVTPALVAGSAFMVGPGTPLTAGRSYAWWDPARTEGAQYWLEEVGLNGERTLYGPIQVTVAATSAPTAHHSSLLSRLGRKPATQTRRAQRHHTRRRQSPRVITRPLVSSRPKFLP